MNAVELSGYTRERIAAIVDGALRDSDALGVLPTPLEAVRRSAGLDLVPVAGLRDEVLGALWFEDRAIYVNESQSACRRRFTEAHEIVHALVPWHDAVLREDTEAELFRPVRDAIEAEANAGAAMLIFQGSAFAARAAEAPCSLAAVRHLAEAYGASLHATLHHYVQSHPRAVAMLITGRFPRKADGALPVWRSVESAAYRERLGSALALAPEGLAPGTPLRELAEGARAGQPATARIGAGAARLRAEAHYNRHAFLVLLESHPRPATVPIPRRRGTPATGRLAA